MAKKKSIDELADEISHDFDAGDTPARRAQAALDQARDAGESGLRLAHLKEAQRQIAAIDPARDPQAVQRLQAQVLALQGRGGDTAIAHVTPGEFVIPGWMQTPEVMRVLAAMAEQAGLDQAVFRVGSGRNAINPRTGQMEFADAWWDISQYLPDYGAAERIGREERARHKGHNDADDAQRHAEWNRRMQTEIGPFTAWSSGALYEADNLIRGQPWRESMMDLHNNAEGRAAASQNRPIDPNNLRTDPKQTRGRY